MISTAVWILATVTLASASVRGNTFFDRVLLGLSQEVRVSFLRNSTARDDQCARSISNSFCAEHSEASR